MVDIQTVSIVIASAGVFIAAFYYVLQLRHQNRLRQTDLLVRLFSMSMTKDFVEAWEKVAERETSDFQTYREKYGLVEASQVSWFFEQLGRLLQQRLININQIPLPYGQIKATWEKLKPIMEGSRKAWNEPKVASGFEYLYNEVKKRQ